MFLLNTSSASISIFVYFLGMTKPPAVVIYILQQEVLFVTVYFSGWGPGYISPQCGTVCRAFCSLGDTEFTICGKILLHSGGFCGILLLVERKYNICKMKCAYCTVTLSAVYALVLCAVNRVIVYSPQASVTLTVKPLAYTAGNVQIAL